MTLTTEQLAAEVLRLRRQVWRDRFHNHRWKDQWEAEAKKNKIRQQELNDTLFYEIEMVAQYDLSNAGDRI